MMGLVLQGCSGTIAASPAPSMPCPPPAPVAAAAPNAAASTAMVQPVASSNVPENAANASLSPAKPSAALDPAGALPVSAHHVVERILDAKVTFFARGEDGRLAVLVDEGGVVMPMRFEAGKWDKLPLPEAHRALVGKSALGMYFGRDNRPRMMGYRTTPEGPRMVYLRYRDGLWQDQRKEVGTLASESSVLFGELGEADPEIVCREGGQAILKGRQGWTVLKASPPKDSVIRGFSGHGYALLGDGLYVGEAKGFVPTGKPAPWKSPVTGFWVGPAGDAVVVEPGASALHALDPKTGAWSSERSPIPGPRDVAGPLGNRYLVGDGGLVYLGASGARRIGEAGLSAARVILIGDHIVAAGPAGVYMIRIR